MPALFSDNEVKTLKMIKIMAETTLMKYPGSIEEDEKLLSEGSLGHDERNCVIERLGEKKVLKFLSEAAKELIPLHSLSYKVSIEVILN